MNVRNGKNYFRLQSYVWTIIQDRNTLETVNRFDDDPILLFNKVNLKKLKPITIPKIIILNTIN